MKPVVSEIKTQDSYVATLSRHGDIDAYLTKLIGKKYSDYRRRWLQVQRDELETDFPLYLSLETMMKCNLRCVFCAYSSDDAISPQQYSEVMNHQLFNSILDQAVEHGCPSMGFNVLNEPLMDKNIISHIEAANRRGIIDTRINTNASLLTKKRANGLIDAGLTRLMVSIDAFKAETYNNVRLRGNYDKLRRNIDQFLEVREKRGAQLPLLRVTFVKLASNQNELPDFIDYWHSLADYIGVQEYTPPDSTDTRYRKYQTGNQVVGESYTCLQPFERIIVRGNGEMYPCCSQVNYKLPLGNIADKSIAQAWTSPFMKDLRAEMRRKTSPADSVCGQCMRGMMNV